MILNFVRERIGQTRKPAPTTSATSPNGLLIGSSRLEPRGRHAAEAGFTVSSSRIQHTAHTVSECTLPAAAPALWRGEQPQRLLRPIRVSNLHSLEASPR